jgi:predicted transcriptional regulator
MNAKALAQAHETCDEIARSLKRHQNTVREAVQKIRQVQANLAGIEVETLTQPLTEGEHSGNNEDTREAA